MTAKEMNQRVNEIVDEIVYLESQGIDALEETDYIDRIVDYRLFIADNNLVGKMSLSEHKEIINKALKKTGYDIKW